MSWWCALLILVSKGQGRNALITENCRIIGFPLLLSSWNFTQRLTMSRWCVLLILGSKGQDHCIDSWKWFMAQNWFFTPIIMKLHTKIPQESRILPLDFEVKVKSQCTINYWKMVYDALLLSLYTYNHETSHTDFSWVKHVPYWFWGQDVKGYNALITENGLSCLIAFYLHQQSWNFTQKLPMGRGLNSRSKGQWSRSQCIDSCKWFMALNCFPIHYNHESSHTDSQWVEDVPFWFQGQKVKGQGHNALILKMLMTQDWNNIKGLRNPQNNVWVKYGFIILTKRFIKACYDMVLSFPSTFQRTAKQRLSKACATYAENTVLWIKNLMYFLQASKIATAASQKTKELGETVNESVIKPTKEKVHKICLGQRSALLRSYHLYVSVVLYLAFNIKMTFRRNCIIKYISNWKE